MRVLHVIPELSTRHGGDSRACAELCESLARQGLDVSLAYFGDTRGEEFRPAGVRLYRCDPWGGRLGKLLAYSPRMRATLKRAVPGSDLVHIHGVWRYLGFAAAHEAHRHSIPYLVQPHGSFHPWKLAHKRIRKWVYGGTFERWVLRHARAIHATTGQDKQHILQYIPWAEVFVVPFGVYGTSLSAPTPYAGLADRWPALRGCRVILCLSRIDVNKGIDLLIPAFQRAAGPQSEWRLLLIGPEYGRVGARLKALSRRLGVAEQVIWTGWATEEEKRLALQQCDFFALASRSENLGIAILEALFCGRPVITTTETPWIQLETAGAGIIVPPSIDHLAQALRRLMSLSRAQLDEMGRRGHQHVAREYDWEVVAGRLKEEYICLLR